jgi:hypothetical protein
MQTRSFTPSMRPKAAVARGDTTAARPLIESRSDCDRVDRKMDDIFKDRAYANHESEVVLLRRILLSRTSGVILDLPNYRIR